METQLNGPPKIWKTGERCRIRFNDQTVLGTITLASTNGRSLMLSFEALLFSPSGGAFAGHMPVLWEGDCFRDLIERERCDVLELD